MKVRTLLGIPLVAVAATGLAMGTLSLASAQQPTPTTYTARLAPVPLNGADGASGSLTLVLNGNQATITEQASGLAATFMNAPFPHVQHIHGGANGVCPAASADTNGDGVLNTAEGQPSYGGILTTLSVSGDTTPAAGTNIQTAPSGATINYSRSITLDAATIDSLTAGKAVIVVHGLDPATAAPAATSSPSELVPSLPLAATSPALCGTLVASAGPAAAASPGAGGATMTPPRTGDGGLINDEGTSWSLYAAAVMAVLGVTGGAALVVVGNRSR